MSTSEAYNLGYDTAAKQYQALTKELVRELEQKIEELENENSNLRHALQEGVRELRETVYNMDNAL